MDSSAKKREGDVMKECNMEDSVEQSAGCFQIVSKLLVYF
jgi:hypothetical protein